MKSEAPAESHTIYSSAGASSSQPETMQTATPPTALSPETQIASVSRWSWALDQGERLLVLGWFSYFVWRLLPREFGWAILGNGLLLVSESLVIALILLRRPADRISLRSGDWLLAIVGTLLPLSAHPSLAAYHGALQLALAVVMLMGLLVQIHAKISLGRSIGMVAADRGIKSTGPYQFVRHPMYAGYFISQVGFLALNPSLWNTAIYTVALVVQLFRIRAEERFLSQNASYRDYLAEVRYRLVPGVF